MKGNTRTSDQMVRRQLGLQPGQLIDQDQINTAVASLRGRRLFQKVDYFTKPGSRRGSVILVLIVQDSSSQLRLGTGQTDLDGWYLIPLELSLDNLLGRAEESRLQFRFGYRHVGLLAHYGEGNAPGDRWHWSLDASTVTTDRVYFSEDVEYAHEVQRGTLGLTVGRRLGRSWCLDLRLQAESAEADSLGKVWQDNEQNDAVKNQDVPFEDLPVDIAGGSAGVNDLSWERI